MAATTPATDPIRREFAEIARRPDDEIDLAHASLWVAAEATPSLDIPSYLTRLDELAAQVEPQIRAAANPESAVAHLNRLLFEQERFRGNENDYYDPHNSFLNDVLDRRRGIPISLSILYIAVAERAGLQARGIGFPGHFLTQVSGEPDILVDPFHCCVVTPDECLTRLRDAFGPEAELAPEMLEPTPRKRILMRMLVNLKQIYLRQNELEAALGCSDRVLLLDPEAALEVRDRGLLFQALECYSAARADLERFIEMAPQDESVPKVRRQLEKVSRMVAKIH